MTANVDTTLSQTTAIILGTIMLFLLYIILPVPMFYLYQFNRLKTHNVFKKRHGDLVVSASILLLIWLGLSIPLYIIHHSFQHLLSPLTMELIKATYTFIFPYCSQISMCLMLTRFWLTYFDFNWTKATYSAKWTVHINPSSHVQSEEWFLKNKATYGNLQLIRKKALIISFSTATFTVIMFQISVFTSLWPSRFVQIFDGLFYVTPMIIILVIWKKTPSLYDALFYRKEMKRVAFSLFFTLINYFIAIIIAFVVGDDMITTIYATCFAIFYGCSVILFQTMWVLSKIKGTTFISSDSSFRRIRSFSQTTDTRNHKLISILNNKDAFNLFMNHLSVEFSMECLLAFVEFNQFKMLLESDDVFMSSFDKGDYKFKIAKLFVDIPQSVIVYGDRTETNQKIKYIMIAKELFQKYVKRSSEFEINISYAMRYGVEHVLTNNCDEHQLYVLFDSCIKELYKLMKHPYVRFMETEKFKTIQCELNEE